MKDRIDATLAAIAEAQEAMIRAEILLKNLQYLRTDENPPRLTAMPPMPNSMPLPPDPALNDDPPSRDP